MLRKIRKKGLLMLGTLMASVLGVYVSGSFSKDDSPLIDIDKAFADVPVTADGGGDGGGGGGGGGGSGDGGADCSGY